MNKRDSRKVISAVCCSSPPLLPVQFLMYIDSVGSDSPMDMETDGPLLDDVNLLKKTMEEEATQVSSVRARIVQRSREY